LSKIRERALARPLNRLDAKSTTLATFVSEDTIRADGLAVWAAASF
jgi:hypothetical protein